MFCLAEQDRKELGLCCLVSSIGSWAAVPSVLLVLLCLPNNTDDAQPRDTVGTNDRMGGNDGHKIGPSIKM